MVTCTPHAETRQRIILLANQPRMFRQLLQRALARASDRQVILEVDTPQQAELLLEQVSAHWLLLSLGPTGEMPAMALRLMAIAGEMSALALRLIARHPHLSLLAIAVDRGRMEVMLARPGRPHRHVPLEDAGLASLLSILRHGEQAPEIIAAGGST